MLTWANVLHIYQPPTQTKSVVDVVVRESYEHILSLLKQYPTLSLTLNIPGSLLELLDMYGHTHIMSGIAHYIKEGRIELLGTAMYHPILPLIPQHEIRRQIHLHNETSKKYFGDAYAPRGFFAPEMAYSKDVGYIVKEMGFSYIILDEIHTEKSMQDTGTLYTDTQTGLNVVCRNRKISQTFPPEYICTHIDLSQKNSLVTMHDGEMYGHRHTDDRGFYENTFTHPHIHTVTLSEYIASCTKKDSVSLISASWETTLEEKNKGIPFSVWNDPNNAIHTALWKFTYTILEIVHTHTTDPHYEHARAYADKGLASCYWWWASERKLGVFSPPSWNPTEIEKGATTLLNAGRTLSTLPKKKRKEIEMMFSHIRDIVWERHWDIMGSTDAHHF